MSYQESHCCNKYNFVSASVFLYQNIHYLPFEYIVNFCYILYTVNVYTFRHVYDLSAEVQFEHQNGEERRFKWFWPYGLVWVFQTLLVYWDFHSQPSLGFTENGQKKKIFNELQFWVQKMPFWCQRMAILIQADRKGTVTQLTIQGQQKSTSEYTKCQTLKQMVYGSRRTHHSCQLRMGYNLHRLDKMR